MEEALMKANSLRLLIVFAVSLACGCQTWSSGMPMQSMSRVPPPGTGTYSPPNGYYNSTSSYDPQSAAPTMMTASSSSSVPGAPPVTTLTTGFQQSNGNFGAVQPAQFTSGSNTGSVANASQFTPVQAQQFTDSHDDGATSTSFSDDESYQDAPNLQWQP